MITKTFAYAAIVVLTVSALAACGSTNNVGQNNTQAARGRASSNPATGA